jgi:tetratricopeptide (TPR) repeat protein
MQAASEHIKAMVEEARASGRSDVEQAESLVEIAFDLQKKPLSPQELWDALFLYAKAAELAKDTPLARARALAGQGAALRRTPGPNGAPLDDARACFEEALPILRDGGEAEEIAEVEMTYGLVLQALAAQNRAPLTLAVNAYQRALRFFTRATHAREYAVLHNNLATAYLSMRMAPEREGLREALAVQSFREALTVVTLDQDPAEYAMLQSNLGNALQMTRTSHPFENLARAVEAYDEALKVRTAHDMPVEHANTLSNKANALMNLPDDPAEIERGNPRNLAEAARLFERAKATFEEHGYPDRAASVEEILASIRVDLAPAAGSP